MADILTEPIAGQQHWKHTDGKAHTRLVDSWNGAEGVTQIATLVWDTNTLAWVRAVQATGGGGGTGLTDAQLRASAVPVSLASAPLPTNAATESGHLATIDTKTPALGQALAASSVPVVLPAAQITTLTPPTSVGVNNFPATQAVSNAGTFAVQATGSVAITNSVDASVTGTITTPDLVVGAASSVGQLTNGASTAGSLVALQCPGGDAAWAVTITGGTFSGIVYFEQSLDSTNGTDGNWASCVMRPEGNPNPTPSTLTQVNNTTWRGNASAAKWVRARLFGGTVTVPLTITHRLGAATGNVHIGGPLPTGGNMIGLVTLNTGTLSVGTVGLNAGTNQIGSVTESTGNLAAIAALTRGDQSEMLLAILRELRLNNYLLQNGLNVSDDLELLRADPFYLQVA